MGVRRIIGGRNGSYQPRWPPETAPQRPVPQPRPQARPQVRRRRRRQAGWCPSAFLPSVSSFVRTEEAWSTEGSTHSTCGPVAVGVVLRVLLQLLPHGKWRENSELATLLTYSSTRMGEGRGGSVHCELVFVQIRLVVLRCVLHRIVGTWGARGCGCVANVFSFLRVSAVSFLSRYPADSDCVN